jgi:hypothetical protein
VTEIDPDHLPVLITALKEDRDDKICCHRADAAEQSDRFLHLSRQRYNEVTRLRDQQAREGRIRRRYDTAVQELNALQSRLADEEAEMKRLNTEKQEVLEAKQKAELESMQTIWRTPVKGRFFNRTSPLLRSMRQQTVLLLNDHRYQEIHQAEVLANRQEELETDLSHHSMRAEYIHASELLRAKHEHEMAVLVHAQDVRLAEHDVQGQAEIRVIEQRIVNLKRKLDFYSDPAKVWALYGRNVHTSDDKKRTVTLVQEREIRNLHHLVLPTLMGPFSARRRAASKRNRISIEDIWRD